MMKGSRGKTPRAGIGLKTNELKGPPLWDLQEFEGLIEMGF